MDGQRADKAQRAQLLVWAAARDVLSACERVLGKVSEARGLDADIPCWACGGGPLVRISMRLAGVEVFWLNACGDAGHQELPLATAATEPAAPLLTG